MVESDLTQLAEEVAEHLLFNGYEWADKNGSHVPDSDEVLAALRWMVKRLDKEPSGTVVFGGRIGMVRTETSTGDNVYDVFVHIGELT